VPTKLDGVDVPTMAEFIALRNRVEALEKVPAPPPQTPPPRVEKGYVNIQPPIPMNAVVNLGWNPKNVITIPKADRIAYLPLGFQIWALSDKPGDYYWEANG
jgi:hypothetical protein